MSVPVSISILKGIMCPVSIICLSPALDCTDILFAFSSIAPVCPIRGECTTVIIDLLGLTAGVCAVSLERGGVGAWDNAWVFI